MPTTFAKGDPVEAPFNTSFRGYPGIVDRVEHRRGKKFGVFRAWVWVLFPTHPWSAKRNVPYSFEAHELKRLEAP